MEKSQTSSLWAAKSVTIRLSAKRSAKLAGLANRLPTDATPTEAIDAAIDLACAAPQSSGDGEARGMEELGLAIEDLAAQWRRDAERQNSVLLEAARNSKAVLDLLSAASSAPLVEEGLDDGFAAPSPIGLAAWLQSELSFRKLRVERSAIVRAQWSGMARSSSNAAAISFEVSLATADEVAFESRERPPALASLELVNIDSDLFRAIAAKAASPLFIVLQPAKPNWRATIFASKADGSIAEKLTTCVI